MQRRELEGRDFLFYDNKGNLPKTSTFSTRFSEYFGKLFPVKPNATGKKLYCMRMLRKTVGLISNRGKPRARDLPNRQAAAMGHSGRVHGGTNYHKPNLLERGYENVRHHEAGEPSDGESQHEDMQDGSQHDDEEEPEAGELESEPEDESDSE
jgi:hypothetical protein